MNFYTRCSSSHEVVEPEECEAGCGWSLSLRDIQGERGCPRAPIHAFGDTRGCYGGARVLRRALHHNTTILTNVCWKKSV
jgi:hypothetical protein